MDAKEMICWLTTIVTLVLFGKSNLNLYELIMSSGTDVTGNEMMMWLMCYVVTGIALTLETCILFEENDLEKIPPLEKSKNSTVGISEKESV